MGKYQAYEKYKDSGVEWLGEIPEHWEVKRLKRFAKICNGCDHKDVWDDNGEYPIIGSGGIFGRASRFLYDRPSVLLGRKGTIDKPQFINVPFWSVDTAYYTDIFPTTNPNFFFYLCLTIDFDLYKYGSAVPSMTQEKLNQILFVTPPLSEQQTIAQFLNYKTKQIDELIAKKETLLEKLDEKRTAIISHAVTKGLDPNVPVKDSGIEWLGEIPEHWEVKRVKFLIQNLQQGSSPLASNIPAQPDELGVLKLSAISRGNFIRHENKALKQIDNLINSFSLKHGDVLLTRGNTPKLVGDACVVPQDEPNLLISDLIYRIRVKDSMILSNFLGSFLITPQARSEIEADARGSNGSMVKVSQKHILDWLITVPPINEQQQITQFLEKKTTEIDQQKAKIQQAIDLLKEYRIALITNAVTGKIDVRKVPIP